MSLSGCCELKHGHARAGQWTPEYVSWKAMKQRCLNKNCHAYPVYGGKGITICAHWVSNYLNFFNDMGPQPFKGATLDRIDNSKGYYPGNCRWASRLEQSINRSLYKNSSTKIKGIGFHKKTGKWQVRVTVDQKRVNLGVFTNLDEAHNHLINWRKENALL